MRKLPCKKFGILIKVARYELIEFDYLDPDTKENVVRLMVKTEVSWGRTFGRCDHRIFYRSGEIYTQARFRAWLKKNLPYMPAKMRETEVAKLLKKVWWQ